MAEIRVGEKVGNYTIIRQIDQGGMSTIYQAHDEAMDRDVAIKVMPREYVNDQEFYGRFQQEVRLIARLEHSHILPVYSYGEHEGIPFLVMRYLEGGTLREIIENGRMPVETIDRIFVQITYALIHAHRYGVIHRDIKPSNVLIDLYGNAYLTDFGIAKLLNSTKRFTPTGAITGTPSYISPEQAQGETEIDFRTDIYALGVLMYEMFTGHVPHEADTPMAMLMKKVNENPPPPSHFVPDIPPVVEKVLLKAIARNPADRYASVREYLLDWKAALTESGISATSYFEEDLSEEERAMASYVTAVSLPKTKTRLSITRRTASLVLMIFLTAAGLIFLTQRSAVLPPFPATEPGFTDTPAAAFAPSATPKTQAVQVKTGTIKTPTPLPQPTQTSTTAPPSPSPGVTDTEVAARGTQDSPVQPKRLAGPYNGSLVHRTGGISMMKRAGIDQNNFITRVVFNNPYSTGKGKWDVNIAFRMVSEEDCYRLAVSSDNYWVLYDERPSQVEKQSYELARGELLGLNPSSNAQNVIMLIVVEDNGFLLLNNQIMSRLDLSMRKNSGDVAIGAGYLAGSLSEGFATRYQDFAVWTAEAAYGPDAGVLYHPREEKVVSHNAALDVWNFVVRARFKSPYPPALAPWSIGFTFRSQKEDNQYRVAALSDSRWMLFDMKKQMKTIVSEGKPANIRQKADEENELLLLVWEGKGAFYVNGQAVGRLDLTSRKYPGDVAVATALLGTDRVMGKATSYSDFTIWALP